MAYSALTSPSLPYLLAASSVAGLSLGAWLLRFPGLAVSVLIVSLVAGQLFRLPLPGQGGGLLVSDIATVLIILSALLQAFTANRRSMTKSEIRMTNVDIRHSTFLRYSCFVISPFILWSLFTLVIRIPDLGASNSLIAALYWLRLSATLVLLPALLVLFQDSALRRLAQQFFFGAITALVILGFLQLILFPNLWDLSRVAPVLAGAKWDPHQGRLFSTWLDPNLFGGFLIVVLPWLVIQIVGGDPTSPRLRGAQRAGEKAGLPAGALAKAGPAVVAVMATVALPFTQSRSSAAALFGTILLLSPLVIWQLHRLPRLARLGIFSSATLSIIMLVALGVFLAPSRLTGLFTIDDTTALRVASLTSAWKLVEYHPWLGVGYNAYQFAAEKQGFLSDFTIHSRAAADNSLLTLWVTTGLIGVALFLIPWVIMLGHLLYRCIKGHLPSLGAAASLVALVIHSQFVNSFLYSHLLIALIIIVAITMTND